MRRSQIKMGETMGILIIFFFLVIFGFSFYTNVQSWTFEQQKRINLELNIIKMYQRAKFMSEFQCSFKDISVDNCYDMYKLLAFEQIIEKEKGVKDYYINMFGQSQINIVELYPGDSQYFIYNNSIGDYTFKEVVGIPVSIYNATSKKFALGLLNITVYSK